VYKETGVKGDYDNDLGFSRLAPLHIDIVHVRAARVSEIAW